MALYSDEGNLNSVHRSRTLCIMGSHGRSAGPQESSWEPPFGTPLTHFVPWTSKGDPMALKAADGKT